MYIEIRTNLAVCVLNVLRTFNHVEAYHTKSICLLGWFLNYGSYNQVKVGVVLHKITLDRIFCTAEDTFRHLKIQQQKYSQKTEIKGWYLTQNWLSCERFD